jgi:uncharacterized protein YndB with AHSA1/START domain
MPVTTIHDTIVLTRDYRASPARVFQAFADPDARARWGAPSPTAALVMDQTSFEVGGLDVSRCGSKGDLRYRVEARYLDIVEGERIVYSETVSERGARLSAGLITIALETIAAGTRLVLTAQLAAFDGGFIIAGNKMGYGAALDNLRAEVEG